MDAIRRLCFWKKRSTSNLPRNKDDSSSDEDSEFEYVDKIEIKNKLIERFGTDEVHIAVLSKRIQVHQLKYAGSGAFSVVKKGFSAKYNSDVAIKIIRLDEEKNESYVKKYLPVELEVWSELSNERHENILNLLESFQDENLLYIVTEIADRGDLGQCLLSGSMPELKAKSMFKQMVSAVAFCHNKGIAHRDIKADNMLLGRNDEIKLADFSFVTKGRRVLEHCGTPGMLAPEQAISGSYDPFLSDIWQLGITLYLMLFKTFPYSNAKKVDLQREIERIRNSYNGVPIPKNKMISTECKDLLVGMLQLDPLTRFDIADVQSHSWLL